MRANRVGERARLYAMIVGAPARPGGEIGAERARDDAGVQAGVDLRLIGVDDDAGEGISASSVASE